MSLEPHRIAELESLLEQLLEIKDADFSNFINGSDSKLVLKPFCNCLRGYWSSHALLANSHTSQIDPLLLKFLLRLCPSFNAKLPKELKDEAGVVKKVKRALISSKKFIDCLFETDPLGLLVYLYTCWNPSEFLDLIRDDLVPVSLIKSIKAQMNQAAQHNEPEIDRFLNWITKSSSNPSSMKVDERESILRRFEYESDDDFMEEDEEVENVGQNQSSKAREIDPIQYKLLALYTANPSVFSRTSQARKLPQRVSLAADTKLSHEQIEGWALMLERNPKKANILQDFIFYSTTKSNVDPVAIPENPPVAPKARQVNNKSKK